MEAVIDYIVKEVLFDNNAPLIESLYNGFRESILKGILEKGERLNLTHYADRLNVSRTPIRQALLRIEKEGFIKRDPQAGFTIIYDRFSCNDEVVRMIEIRKQFYLTCLNLQYNEWEASRSDLLRGILEDMKRSVNADNQFKLRKDYQRFYNELIGVRLSGSESEISKTLMIHTIECEEMMLFEEKYRTELLEHLEQIIEHFESDHVIRVHLSMIFNLMKLVYEHEIKGRRKYYTNASVLRSIDCSQGS